jgi:lysophospholipase L1-like esterase
MCPALAGLEAYCRLVLDDGMRYEFEMFKYATKLKTPSSHAAVSFVHRPNSHARIMGADVVINEQGLREDRIVSAVKPPRTTRVLMLGDSIAFGFGVAAEDTVSRRLEARLNRGIPNRRFEVVNAGVGNYNTAMEAAYYLEQGRTLNPDLVILNVSFNDAEVTPRPRGNLMTRHSYATTYISGRLDLLLRTIGLAPDWRHYYLSLYQDDQPGWAQAQAGLRALKETCDEGGTTLAVVNYPELHQLIDYPLAAVNQRIEDLSRSLSVPYLDLLPAVADEPNPRRYWVHDDDPHPNGAATDRFAARIGDWLIDTPGLGSAILAPENEHEQPPSAD